MSIGYKCAKTMEEEDASNRDMNDDITHAVVTPASVAEANISSNPLPEPLLQAPPKGIAPMADHHPAPLPPTYSRRQANTKG